MCCYVVFEHARFGLICFAYWCVLLCCLLFFVCGGWDVLCVRHDYGCRLCCLVVVCVACVVSI